MPNPNPVTPPKFLEVAKRKYGEYDSPIGDRTFTMRFPKKTQDKLLEMDSKERLIFVRNAVEEALEKLENETQTD
ncbi:MAG: hypothetical protein ACOVQ7_15755 [Limnoraphis robusta]